MTETELRRHYVAAMSAAREDVKLWIRNVGSFELSTGARFRAGVAGQGDVYGWKRWARAPGSYVTIPLEIELKNVRTKTSKEQVAWANLCSFFGVPHLLLRAQKGESGEQTIARWVDETSRWLDGM